MDNVFLNINGRLEKNEERLKLALKIALASEYDSGKILKVQNYMVSYEHGLVFTYGKSKDSKELPFETNDIDFISKFIVNWLENIDFDSYEMKDMEENCEDEDISVEKGWRLYLEQWGHVGEIRGARFAIKPMWLWYGK